MAEKYERLLPLVIFGDGYFGWLADEAPPEKDISGQKKKPLLIVPHPHTIEIAKIREEELPITTPEGKKAAWVRYPKEYVKWMNQSPRDAVLLIECTFREGETDLIESKAHLYDLIRVLQERIEGQKGIIAWLQEQMKSLGPGALEVIRREQEIRQVLTGQAVLEGEED